MSTAIPVETFRESFLIVLEEVFEKVHGYLLDEGTSLFETLANVTSADASRTISTNCASLAAQVNHTRFYLDVINEGARSGTEVEVHWDGSWSVGPVDDSQWGELVERLDVSYRETKEFVRSFEAWDAPHVGGALALLAHCAYHLGEIRQGLGVLRG